MGAERRGASNVEGVVCETVSAWNLLLKAIMPGFLKSFEGLKT